MYIREIFKNHKCFAVDKNTSNNIFLKYFKEEIFPNKETIKKLLSLFNSTTVKKNMAIR